MTAREMRLTVKEKINEIGSNSQVAETVVGLIVIKVHSIIIKVWWVKEKIIIGARRNKAIESILMNKIGVRLGRNIIKSREHY